MNKMQILKKLGDGVMPIVGFYGPPDACDFEGKHYESLKTEKMFKMIEECGINITMQMNDPVEFKPEIVQQTLDLCAKYNILYLLYTETLFKTNNWRKEDEFKYDNSTYDTEINNIISVLQPFINHKGCGGVYMWDEPSKKDLPYIGTLYSMFKKSLKIMNAEDKMCYINLLPWNNQSGNTFEDYDDYLNKAIEEGKLDYLSYDSYPFVYSEVLKKEIPEAKQGISPGIYNMAAQVREAALRYNVPFWGFVQMGGNWTEEIDNMYVRRPSSSEVVWEVNVLLAFGAKGIQYYTLNNPVSGFKYLKNHGETGAFLPNGEKSDLFDACKQSNMQIKACDEILMFSTSTQIIVHGDMPTIMEYDGGVTKICKYKELETVEGCSSIIGCFDYNGKTVLYVVNNNVKESGEIILKFNDTYKIRKINYNLDETNNFSEIKINLSAGEAVLLEIQEKV